jgi:succinoglycan biosynthesis protein ExoA
MPTVSVIIPCYNEQATIRLALDGLYRQSYPLAEMEVILADGMSSDATRAEVTRFQADYPDLAVRLVDNPNRNIPSGLNRALEAARGAYIVRLDAHAVPGEDYVARSVTALQQGEGENVGGVWEIRPGGSGWVARAIAAAAAHPLGVGDALYRFSSKAAYVDTVPFGAFKRETLANLGGYDETLLTNEDYELNARLRAQGGRIRLDPSIRSGYFARSRLGDLARQYFRYGFWKWQMLRRYPGTLRWRQALPPLFVLGLAGLLGLSFFWNLARILLVSGIGVYLFALCAGSLPVALKKRDPLLVVGMPLAIAVMHLSWGSGFLVSLLRGKKR